MRRSPRRGRPARGSATLVIVLAAVVGLAATPLNAVASAQTPAGRAASPSLHRPATRAAARVVPTVSVIADPATALVAFQSSCGDDDLLEPGAFVFTRDDPTGPLPVGYTLGGDAVAGRDYAALPGEVAFADGQTSVTVPVEPLPTLSADVVTATVSARPGYRVGATGAASVAFHRLISDCFPNTLWIKNRIRGDAPNPPAFSMRLQCSGRGGAEEHLLTFTDQTLQTVLVPAVYNNCVLKEIDAGGAASVEYFAKSATGDATSGPRSARVEFGASGGGYARLQVTNRFSGSCPTTPPNYC